jgi:hypothetical protein
MKWKEIKSISADAGTGNRNIKQVKRNAYEKKNGSIPKQDETGIMKQEMPPASSVSNRL